MAKKRITGRFKFFILFVVAVYTCVGFITQEIHIKEQEDEIRSLEEQKQQATVDKEFAEENLLYISTNNYVEKVARERLGWVKPNEIRFYDEKK